MLADKWEQQGDAAAADLARKQAQTLADRTAFDFFIRGAISRENDQDVEASACFLRALELDPGNLPATRALAFVLIDAEQPKLAELYFSQLIMRFPQYRDGFFGRGMSRKAQGKLKFALQDFDRAHELDPTDFSASLRAGKVLLQLNQWSAAADRLEASVKINQSSMWAPLELARAYTRLQEYGKARLSLDRSISNGEAAVASQRGCQRLLPNAYIERAKLHLRAEATELAAADLERAQTIAWKYRDRFAMRHVAKFYLQGPVSLRDAEKALPLAKTSADQRASRISLYLLAVAYYETDHFQDALETAKRAMDIGDLSWVPRLDFVLASSFWQLGQYEEARHWYRRGKEDEVEEFREQADQLMGESSE